MAGKKVPAKKVAYETVTPLLVSNGTYTREQLSFMTDETLAKLIKKGFINEVKND